MRPNLRHLGLLAVLLITAGCRGANPISSPTSPGATGGATSSVAPTTAPTPQPTPGPTPVVYYEVMKNGEGAHGGIPIINLPAAVVIDYSATGMCNFTIRITKAVPDNAIPVASLAISVTGSSIAGSWPVHIEAGSYYVTPGEALGCTFVMRVHDPA